MSAALIWGRLRSLLSFFQTLIGRGGIVKMLLSGLAISLIELGGLALVFPFLKLATDADSFDRLAKWASDTILSGIVEQHHRAVLLSGIMIAMIYIFRGWLSARLVRYQSSVAARINSLTSNSIISDALGSRYQLFLEHSPVKIAGVSYSNTTHAALLFQSMLSGFNEAVLLLIVVTSMVLANPFAFLLFALVSTVLIFGFFRPLSHRVARIGQRSQEIDLSRHRFVFAMANAIRDIKIMGLEKSFSHRNRDLAYRHANLAADYTSIAAVQRIAVEIVLVCSIIVAAVWYSLDRSDLNQSGPLLATLGLIAMRSAPALSRLAGAYNGFRYSLPFVESLLTLRRELAQFPQQRIEQAADFPGEYRAEGLCFSYGSRQVLSNCTLSIAPGEIVVIAGPSGAGKSTLLDLLAGLQPPSSGKFFLGGAEFSPFLSDRFPSRVGYVPQSIAILDDSIAFNIALEDKPDPIRLRRAVSQSMLTGLIESLPDGMLTRLGDGGQGLSGGQRQRIGIARALYRGPALLILDEVTSALDAATAQAVVDELVAMRTNMSMLFVTHDPKLVPADRTYLLDDGLLALQVTESK